VAYCEKRAQLVEHFLADDRLAGQATYHQRFPVSGSRLWVILPQLIGRLNIFFSVVFFHGLS